MNYVLVSPRVAHGPAPTADCTVEPCDVCTEDCWIAPSSRRIVTREGEPAMRLCRECAEIAMALAVGDGPLDVQRPEGADDELIDHGNARLAASDRAYLRRLRG